jgi:hypothetical protein
MRSFLLLCSFLICCHMHKAYAQATQWEQWQKQVDDQGIVIAPPVENQFRFVFDNNSVVKFDYAVVKQKGDLEIRYLIQPADSIAYPHISTSNLLMTLATNDPEFAISVLPIEADVLKKDYQADWGVQAFFHPKLSFSDKTHGKLIAIYKEGKAIVYTVLLFDDVEISWENYEFILTFASNKN